VLDFVNTGVFAGANRESDILRAPEVFLAWAREADLAHGDTDAASDRPPAMSRARRLRAALRGIAEALAAGREPDARALTTLTAAAAVALRSATCRMDGMRLTWSWNTASVDGVLARIAVSAVDLMRGELVDRIGICPGCGFLLLDTTKNRTRRWCTMEDCGTQEKMRRYVARRAAARRR
jgi:predicted RNA-binding Zn ribbon-like protein